MSPSKQLHIPVVFDPSVMSSVPKDSPLLPPLQVYSHRQSSHRPQDDSLLVPNLPSLPAPIVEPDIPIAIRNGIRYTRNQCCQTRNSEADQRDKKNS